MVRGRETIKVEDTGKDNARDQMKDSGIKNGKT